MIILTESARNKIKHLAQDRSTSSKGPFTFRVGLQGGGCTGFTFVFEWSRSAEGDSIIDMQEFQAEGESMVVQVVTDQKSIKFLDGATLDYEKTLMKSGFKWINPKQTGSCGCGKSVMF